MPAAGRFQKFIEGASILDLLPLSIFVSQMDFSNKES